MINMKWRDATLTIDGEFGPFAGQVNDTRWNGWACPRFARGVAEEVVRKVIDLDGDTYTAWRWDGDVLELTVQDGDETPERWEADADGFYHVGSWAWCWTEREEV